MGAGRWQRNGSSTQGPPFLVARALAAPAASQPAPRARDTGEHALIKRCAVRPHAAAALLQRVGPAETDRRGRSHIDQPRSKSSGSNASESSELPTRSRLCVCLLRLTEAECVKFASQADRQQAGKSGAVCVHYRSGHCLIISLARLRLKLLRARPTQSRSTTIADGGSLSPSPRERGERRGGSHALRSRRDREKRRVSNTHTHAHTACQSQPKRPDHLFPSKKGAHSARPRYPGHSCCFVLALRLPARTIQFSTDIQPTKARRRNHEPYSSTSAHPRRQQVSIRAHSISSHSVDLLCSPPPRSLSGPIELAQQQQHRPSPIASRARRRPHAALMPSSSSTTDAKRAADDISHTHSAQRSASVSDASVAVAKLQLL